MAGQMIAVEVGRVQSMLLDRGAHRTVEDHDSLGRTYGTVYVVHAKMPTTPCTWERKPEPADRRPCSEEAVVAAAQAPTTLRTALNVEPPVTTEAPAILRWSTVPMPVWPRLTMRRVQLEQFPLRPVMAENGFERVGTERKFSDHCSAKGTG